MEMLPTGSVQEERADRLEGSQVDTQHELSYQIETTRVRLTSVEICKTEFCDLCYYEINCDNVI